MKLSAIIIAVILVPIVGFVWLNAHFDQPDPMHVGMTKPTIENARMIRSGMDPGKVAVLLGPGEMQHDPATKDLLVTHKGRMADIVVRFAASRSDLPVSEVTLEKGDRVEKLRCGSSWWDSLVRRFDFSEGDFHD